MFFRHVQRQRFFDILTEGTMNKNYGTFDFFLSQLTEFDEKDKELFQEGLIGTVNEKYKRDH